MSKTLYLDHEAKTAPLESTWETEAPAQILELVEQARLDIQTADIAEQQLQHMSAELTGIRHALKSRLDALQVLGADLQTNDAGTLVGPLESDVERDTVRNLESGKTKWSYLRLWDSAFARLRRQIFIT